MSVTQEHDSRPSAGSRSRRRPRQQAPRPRTVRFDLTEEEFAELEQAAGRAGLAKGAYAAEAALSAARGTAVEPDTVFREALGELIRASGLVRKIGTLLNQAVAKLNATGQHPAELVPCRAGVPAPRGTAGCRRGTDPQDGPVTSGWHPVRRGWTAAPGTVVRWSGTGPGPAGGGPRYAGGPSAPGGRSAGPRDRGPGRGPVAGT